MNALLSRSPSIHLGTAERNIPAHGSESIAVVGTVPFPPSSSYPPPEGAYLDIRTSRTRSARPSHASHISTSPHSSSDARMGSQLASLAKLIGSSPIHGLLARPRAPSTFSQPAEITPTPPTSVGRGQRPSGEYQRFPAFVASRAL